MDKCFYECGRTATTNDHIITSADRGADAPENYVRACLTCNSDRGNQPIGKFMRSLGLDKEVPVGMTANDYMLTRHPTEDLTIAMCDWCTHATVLVRPVSPRHKYRFCSDRHRQRFYAKLNRKSRKRNI